MNFVIQLLTECWWMVSVVPLQKSKINGNERTILEYWLSSDECVPVFRGLLNQFMPIFWEPCIGGSQLALIEIIRAKLQP
jgi:hypothetical protein